MFFALLRAHGVFTITVEQRDGDGGRGLRSKIVLADLAGKDSHSTKLASQILYNMPYFSHMWRKTDNFAGDSVHSQLIAVFV